MGNIEIPLMGGAICHEICGVGKGDREGRPYGLFDCNTQGLVACFYYIHSFCLNLDGQDLMIFRMCGIYAFALEVIDFYSGVGWEVGEDYGVAY